MGDTITHIDVGYSRQVANILGIQPTTLILCGAKDGLTIRDNRTMLKIDGNWPAACNCGPCQRIARIMHDYDVEPAQARSIYEKEVSRKGRG